MSILGPFLGFLAVLIIASCFALPGFLRERDEADDVVVPLPKRKADNVYPLRSEVVRLPGPRMSGGRTL